MLGSQASLSSFTTFGDLLKYLRRRVQLSQRELSIAVGYSESQISRLESNLRTPDSSSLLALFVPALQIEDEPEVIERLLYLAKANRAEVPKEEPADQKKAHKHLPIQLTSFIGRKEDLTEVCRVLYDPEARLVTLTGEGGCGKTRLALQAGSELIQKFKHGVWLVELGSLPDPELTLNVITAALGLHASTDDSLMTMLTEFLSPREILLILDNCEHLIEAVAQLTGRLLKVCPRLKILATSRESLGVPGEVIFRVLPLSLPPAQRGVQPSRAQVEAYEAIQLFVARARSMLRSFEFTDRNAPAIARICQRLDGIPLAIELAAAWVNTLSVEQIADRLEEDFNLLVGRNRSSLPQHQSLRAAIDWSYNLLTEAERVLLRRLSVFAGSWSIEVAEEVVSGTFDSSSPIARKQVPNLLTSLVNKSLIFVEQTEAIANRYRLLDTIRDYLHEKVTEVGEMDWLQSQHLAYFCKMAETAEPELKTKNQILWMDWLIQEKDNFRAAFSYCQAQGKSEEGLRLAGALGHFWWMRGFDNENLKWFEMALQMSSSNASLQRSQPRAKVLLYLGLLFYVWGLKEAHYIRQLWEESLDISHELDDAIYAGASLCFLAEFNHLEARSTFKESLQLLYQAEDDWWIAETLH